MKNKVRRKTTLLQKYNDLTLHQVDIIAYHPGSPEVESRISYYVVHNAPVGYRKILKRYITALNFFRQQKRNMDGP